MMSLSPTISYYLLSQPAAELSDVETDIKNTFERLADGESFVQYEKDVTLFVGKSGAGTTSLLAHLTSDNSKLEVKRDGAKVIIEGQAISRTIFPTLLGSGAHHYYDCPSFTNSRNLVDDITATYFVKKVVDQASRLRMVLVAEYSLFETDSCDGLTEQFSYIIGTIKNIGALRACMGMVVTKVPIDGQSDGQATIKRIGDKLVSYKPKLEEAFAKEPEKLQAVGELVDLLTETDEKHNYRRLAIFFEPPAPPSQSKTLTLDKIQLLQEEKPKIQLMVQKLSFADRQTLKINYRLAQSSLGAVSSMTVDIHSNLDSLMNSVGNSLRNYLHSVVASGNDVHQVRKDLQTNIHALKSLETGLSEIEDARVFELNLSTYLPAFKIGAPQATLVEVSRQISYLQFLKKVTSLEIRLSPAERVKPIRKAIAEYEDELCWSQFVIGLLEDLSKFRVQQDRNKYDVKDVNLWGKGDEKSERGIEITDKNLPTFIDKLQDPAPPGYVNAQLRSLTATPSRLAKLNDVLKLTLRQEPVWDPKPDAASGDAESTRVEVLTCKGAYVRISDVRKALDGKTNFETLRIFATRGVFLDEDVMLSGKNISLLTTSVDLTDARKLDVSGESITVDLGKAKDGYTVDEKHFPPANSSTGAPGKSAGNLVVGYMNLKLDHNLSLIADGGNGGTGQQGGDGYPGNDGINAPGTYSGSTPTFKYDYKGSEGFFGGTKYFYYVYAKPGDKGGDGGAGGDGGTGGNCGRAVVAGVQTSVTGKPGIGGRGGQPGKGGKGGRGAWDIYTHYADCWVLPNGWSSHERYPNPDQPSGNQGRFGRDGSPGKLVENVDRCLALEINAYKSFVFENYNQGPSRYDLSAFMRHINRANTFRGVYDVYALCDELVRYQEGGSIVTLELYRGLMERIEEFLEPERTFTDDEMRCLRYLYTSTQGEICRLESSNNRYMVTNLNIYLEDAVNDLDHLRSARAAETIADLRAKFGKQIHQLVSEARKLINDHLPKDIDDSMKHMKDLINNVLDEVADTEAKLEKDKAALKKLQSYEIAMFALDILSSLSSILVVLGPVGEVAALGCAVVFQGSKRIVKAAMDPDENRPDAVTNVPDSVKRAKEEVDNALTNEKKHIVSEADQLKIRIKRMRELLKPELVNPTASTNYVDGPGADDDWRLGLAEADRQLSQALADITDIEHNPGSLTELNQLVAQTENKVNQTAKESSFKGWGDLASEVRSAHSEINDHVDQHIEKSDKISKALAEIDESLKNLAIYKKKIRTQTLPMIDDLGYQMSQVQDQLVGQSQAALDIAKWNIRGILDEMKHYLKGATQGFEVEEEVGRTVMKVDAAITTMISIYDRIQNYQSQARMADHVADVATASIDEVDVSDPKLHEVAVKMRTRLYESLLLERYGACYSAFRQWAFPLANLLLATVTLPEALDRDGAQVDPADELRKMQTVIYRYRSGIFNEDNTIERGEFDSDVRQLPFYTWSNSSFKPSIVDLLAGKSITLLADIRNSPPGKDAIKFIRLGIKFRLDDKARSKKLLRALSDFKLSLRHSGTSHYRVRQEFYAIQSASLEIVCQLRTKPDGSPVGRNVVYDKLLKGDQMLSPYTLWSIELIRNNSGVTYEPLKPFEDVDLELVGEGWSIDAARSKIDYGLEKYGYKRADFPVSLC